MITNYFSEASYNYTYKTLLSPISTIITAPSYRTATLNVASGTYVGMWTWGLNPISTRGTDYAHSILETYQVLKTQGRLATFSGH